MRADGEARTLIVGHKTIGGGHGRERSRIPNPGSRIPFGKQLSRRPDGLLNLPQRRAPIVAERIQRADVGERLQLLAAQVRARNEILN